MKLLNTNQAAEKLGVSVRRVRALIAEGLLQAHQIGREYAIEENALSSVRVYGKPGRPPMTEEKKAARVGKRAKVAASSADLKAKPKKARSTTKTAAKKK